MGTHLFLVNQSALLVRLKNRKINASPLFPFIRKSVTSADIHTYSVGLTLSYKVGQAIAGLSEDHSFLSNTSGGDKSPSS
jgi:hypothetical protein